MILPCEDNSLRRIAMDRYAQRVGRFDILPRDIENLTSDIINKEIELQRRIESLKRELQSRYDYQTYAAYKAIDKYNDGFIDTFNLSKFLKNNGHYASERELIAIIRRIDTDGDAKISYSEFSDSLKTSFVPESSSSYNRSMSEERNRASLLGSRSSPLRAKSYASPDRGLSASGHAAY